MADSLAKGGSGGESQVGPELPLVPIQALQLQQPLIEMRTLSADGYGADKFRDIGSSRRFSALIFWDYFNNPLGRRSCVAIVYVFNAFFGSGNGFELIYLALTVFK